MSNEIRVLPLKDDFMKDKKVNDIIYGLFQSKSYLKENRIDSYDNIRYVYKDDITLNSIKNYYDNNEVKLRELNVSASSLKRLVKLLKDIGYLKESIINNKEVYILPHLTNNFISVKTETLQYLVNTANRDVIKVYCYLKAKYNYKDNYEFTEHELLNAIGYRSLSTENYNKIKDILVCLSNNGLIAYHIEQKEIHKSNGKKYNTFYHILDIVNDNYIILNTKLKPKEIIVDRINIPNGFVF